MFPWDYDMRGTTWATTEETWSEPLHFGVGNTITPGTFFSGLIDDIRIYEQAVSP